MNLFSSKIALLSLVSAGAFVSLNAYTASAQTPWDVYRQQYQLTTGAPAANQPVAPAPARSSVQATTSGQGGQGSGASGAAQSEISSQTSGAAAGQGSQAGAQGSGANRVIQSGVTGQSSQTPAGSGQPALVGQGAATDRVVQTGISGQTGQGGTGQAGASSAGGRDLFQFTNQTTAASSSAQGSGEGVTRYLQQGVSVETATVPQLASAIAQYAATAPEMVVGAVAVLSAGYPDQAVKIAEASAQALPDRAIEIAMAISAAVPSAAIQIVVALAAADPALASTLAGLILPAAGGINQTSSSTGGRTTIQEIPIRVSTTPGNGGASPTGGG